MAVELIEASLYGAKVPTVMFEFDKMIAISHDKARVSKGIHAVPLDIVFNPAKVTKNLV